MSVQYKQIMSPDIKYSRLAWGKAVEKTDDEPSDSDDAEANLLDEGRQKSVDFPRPWRRLAPWLIHGGILATYLIVLPYLMPAFFGPYQRGCVDKHNYYSPINEAISEDYVDVRFNGSLWYQSPYKGPPTPEVEAAWQDLMKYGAISVTADDITRIGHQLTAVQYPPEAGGGYLAVAMGTHQIHCLHYMWQDHHAAYFPETQAKKEGIPEMYERHYEHCVDYIRQTLMCNFDPGIVPYYWVLQHNQPTPDGNTRHKCVNWDALQGWLEDRAVPMPDGFEWHQPPDAVSLPQNP